MESVPSVHGIRRDGRRLPALWRDWLHMKSKPQGQSLVGEAMHPASIAYFRALIEESIGSELIDAAKGIPDFSRGFRPGRVDEATLRKRALAAYGKSHSSTATLSLLRNLSLQRSLISVLSEEALQVGEIPFTRYFGAVAFFSAMSIDPRPTVAELGQSGLKSIREEGQAKASDAAAKDIRKEFQPFFEKLRQITDAADGPRVPKQGTSNPADAAALRVGSNQTAGQLQKLVDGSPTTRRLRRELTVSQGRLKREMESRQALESRIPALEEEGEAAKLALAQLRDQLQTEVSKRVADLFNKRLGGLFGRTAQGTLPGNGLSRSDRGAIATAKRVLEAQAQEDAHYGTRTALARELEEAKTLYAALQEASLESLRPLPDIPHALEGLSRLVSVIETRLGVDRLIPRQLSEPIKRFLFEVSAAQTISEIAQKREQLEAIRISNQWNSKDISTAEEALSNAALKHYADHLDDREHRDLDILANASPLNALRVALALNRAALIVIDGHNVLHQLRPIWGQHFERGKPGTRARQHLIALLSELCDIYHGVSVDLWFDSNSQEQFTVSSRMRVLYSGGSGSDRADIAIAGALEHIEAHKNTLGERNGITRALYVVSADRQVRASAKRFKALAMYPTELAAVLGV
jgi:hypothetical protein